MHTNVVVEVIDTVRFDLSFREVGEWPMANQFVHVNVVVLFRDTQQDK